jgi:hypothetical protein
MVLVMESSKTDLSFTSFCAQWVPEQLRGDHMGNCLMICQVLLTLAFRGTLSMGMRHGSTSTLQKAKPEYGMEISHITSQKEVQNSTIGRKSDVGFTRANSGTLLREQHNSKQWPL